MMPDNDRRVSMSYAVGETEKDSGGVKCYLCGANLCLRDGLGEKLSKLTGVDCGS